MNNLLNVRGKSLGWTLRIIGFMQLALMIVAIILIQPRFPRNSEREILPLKHYFTDRRTVVFTAAIFVMNLGIYVPWVSTVSFEFLVLSLTDSPLEVFCYTICVAAGGVSEPGIL